MLCLDLVVVMTVKTFKYRFRKVKAKSSKYFSSKRASQSSYEIHHLITLLRNAITLCMTVAESWWTSVVMGCERAGVPGRGEGGVWRHCDFPIGYSDVYVITDNRVPGELRLRLFDAIPTGKVTLFQQLCSGLTLVKILRW